MRYTTTHPSPWLYLHPSYATLVFLIKWNRIAKGYTIARLAAKLGASPAYVAQREDMEGAASFTRPMLQRLALLLDAPAIAAFRYPRSRQPRVQLRIYCTRYKDRVEHHINIGDVNDAVVGECVLIERKG